MSKTLLLADDSVVIQKLVGLSFANEDVEIYSTDNGDDAVTKARELRPDLVLADVVMPGKSGYEVCEAIKQDPALAHIPVLLLTGTFEAFDEARAQAVGATGHITKPFEAQALVERVKTVIKNSVKPAAVREPAPSLPPTADDLFDDERLLPPPARASFFGSVESLDITPSLSSAELSEEDLNDSLDLDLFGAPGDVEGATPSGGTSFRGAHASLDFSDSDRFADAPIEDATVALIPEPIEALVSPVEGLDTFGADLGFDDPIEIAPLPAASFDLDSSFDPAPSPASASLGSSLTFARDDANASTSRSLGKSAYVADLDEMLATPAPTRSSAPSIPGPASAQRPELRGELLPEAPTLVDFGPTEHSSHDLDFGFDVSEQLTVSKNDLLEESFSSLLDVSESQMLGDATPDVSSPWATLNAPRPSASEPPGGADFDVSSSDLATAAAPLFTAPVGPQALDRPQALIAREAPLASPDLDFFSSPAASPGPSPSRERFPAELPPPIPASAAGTGTSASSAAAVAHMSPILQQQVQETLEKVAWEAFSDLSETIVKQVIERIERIAWEVIPQMAETLVREEIRKMKGEND